MFNAGALGTAGMWSTVGYIDKRKLLFLGSLCRASRTALHKRLFVQRLFSYQFSKIAESLRRLLAGGLGKGKKSPQKNPQFVWTRECQHAFETLIAKLTSPPILGFPDFKLPSILHTDASGNGLVAALYQIQDNKARVIALRESGFELGRTELLSISERIPSSQVGHH